MSVADSDSALRTPGGSSVEPAGTNHSGIWLAGDVLSCACPDCRAPMAIRLWLRLATCWQCGTTVELTEEQERAARQLLAAQQMPTAAKAPVKRQVWAEPVAEPAPQPQLNRAGVQPITVPPVPPNDWHWRGPLRNWRLLGDPISWLVSVILHMVLVILLGIWMIGLPQDDTLVTLAAHFDERNHGDARIEEDSLPTVSIDTPEKQDLEPVDVTSSLAQVDVQLPEMAPVMGAPAIELPNSKELPILSAGLARPGELLAGRDPGLRGQMLLREGGSTQSEEAVQLGLQWIARHQNEDGSWSLDNFMHAGDCNGRCDQAGVFTETGGTALALLPFLGAGQTHTHGEYIETVARGLRWLIDEQRPDGDLRGAGSGNMYAHGQAAIVLCEAYALTQHELLREPAQKSIDFIVAAQHRQGGWRYKPGQEGDLSVVGWQLMALRSAEMAYLKVPPKTTQDAVRFLHSVQADTAGSTYTYMPGGGPRDTMTAEGLLCRQYSGWKRNNPALLRGADWLLRQHPPEARNVNMYYWYYATQVMHHMGGTYWQDWNSQLRDTLIDLQVKSGHETGSWAPKGGHDRAGGRLYMTSLAVCTLEVYYRHLPLYREGALGQGE